MSVLDQLCDTFKIDKENCTCDIIDYFQGGHKVDVCSLLDVSYERERIETYLTFYLTTIIKMKLKLKTLFLRPLLFWYRLLVSLATALF